MSEKIKGHQLERGAYVYVRQSLRDWHAIIVIGTIWLIYAHSRRRC